MKRLVACLVATLFTLALAPHALAGAQQDKMKACNAEAKEKDLKGDERKKFMSDCLSAKKEKADDGKAKTAQQEKMTKCNADAKAKSLAGDERKKFMSDCLKG